MTKPENDLVFATHRTGQPQATPVEADRPLAVVISDTAGLAEMVARGMTASGETQATHLVMSLDEFVALEDLSLDALKVCLFEVKQGDDSQLAALRTLKEMAREDVKILGMTSHDMTLPMARQLMDAGVDDVVPLGQLSPSLSHSEPLAAATDAAAANRSGGVHNGVIMGVAQTRGGIGATTFAINLATLLAQPAKQKRGAPMVTPPRVAVVDLDLQNGTLGASIDAPDTNGFVDMLRNGTLPDATELRKLMVSHKAGFDILPAPVEFVPLTAMTPEMMASLLDELRLSYDFIVLDMPRTMVDWLAPVLARADQLFLLTDTAVHSVRQARRMMDFYREDHLTLPIDLCVSLERKPLTTSSAVKEAENFLDQKLAHWVPRDDKAAHQANDKGEPLLVTRPRSAVAKSMAPMITDLQAYAAQDQRREA